MSSLAERLSEIEARISSASKAANRSREDIELIVVTKKHPVSLNLELLDLGVNNFGENRDQDAKPKAQELEQLCSGKDLHYRWHFIGQLQSNKFRSALSYASVFHSLDRQSLLDAMISATLEHPEPVDVFIQLNLTEDPARGGIEPVNLLKFAESVLACSKLNLQGVMGVASLDRSPEVDFETIAQASESLRSLAPEASSISAGMSEDFEAAIAFGATHLRIGGAITGKPMN
jgi:pyridoxal phosphate enzyme (YggS family)